MVMWIMKCSPMTGHSFLHYCSDPSPHWKVWYIFSNHCVDASFLISDSTIHFNLVVLIITFVKDVMFLLVLVCLYVLF